MSRFKDVVFFVCESVYGCYATGHGDELGNRFHLFSFIGGES
jgi:hypothetical protein